MRLKDNLGQTTAIDFSDVDRGAQIDPATFRFEPPAGVDVIRGTGS